MTDEDERHVVKALGVLMDEARRLMLRDNLEPGLRPSHLRVLGSVPPRGSITVTELAQRVGMTKQGIGQFVTQLTSAGYLATGTDPDDRRVRMVSRTPRGEQAVHEFAESMRGLESRWARQVGERRYRQFRAVLDDLAELG